MIERHREIRGMDLAVALVLALVWLCGGSAGIAIGMMYGHWVLVGISVMAFAYGAVWVLVFMHARLRR